MTNTFQLIDLMDTDNCVNEVRHNFKDALRDLYERIISVSDQRRMTLQWLETMVWIGVQDISGGGMLPIYFYDARDIAIKYGFVNDGEITIDDTAEEPDSDMLLYVGSLCSRFGNAKEYIENLKRAA